MVYKVGDSFQVADGSAAVLSPRSYIPAEDKVVTIEDSALESRGVAFGLATRITLPRDRSALEALKTFDLRIDSFEHLVTVRFVPFSFMFLVPFFFS